MVPRQVYNGLDGVFIWRIEMPKALEQRLKKEAKKKHLGKERTNAYVYGTLRKIGWKPKRKK